jgi:hypothetical protein
MLADSLKCFIRPCEEPINASAIYQRGVLSDVLPQLRPRWTHKQEQVKILFASSNEQIIEVPLLLLLRNRFTNFISNFFHLILIENVWYFSYIEYVVNVLNEIIIFYISILEGENYFLIIKTNHFV